MIRLATESDLPRLLEIYDTAKAFMRRSGNPTQWTDSYPGRALLLEDVGQGRLYVMERGGRVYACFMLCPGPDPTYSRIDGGAWGSDSPYGVIHRVASDGTRTGILGRCVAFAGQTFRHLRIDTHQDNIPMQRALASAGFIHQ